jgi:hypothetical protein
MPQREFGRRQAQPAGGRAFPSTRTVEASAAPSPNLGPDPGQALALADAPSRFATRSVMILAGVGTMVLVLALGAAYGLNAAISSGDTVAASQQECRGQANCANQYDVALTCGSSDEPRSASVIAADAEAAERKAERYNRDCRSRRAVFVSSLIRSAAYTAYGGQRANEPAAYASRKSTTTLRMFRMRRR